MTRTAILLAEPSIRVALHSFAATSIITPSHAGRRQTDSASWLVLSDSRSEDDPVEPAERVGQAFADAARRVGFDDEQAKLDRRRARIEGQQHRAVHCATTPARRRVTTSFASATDASRTSANQRGSSG